MVLQQTIARAPCVAATRDSSGGRCGGISAVGRPQNGLPGLNCGRSSCLRSGYHSAGTQRNRGWAVNMVSKVPDPKARYKQLLFFASKLPPMAAEDHTDDNKVLGCVSQVWVKPELKDGKVFWTADSDSQLTKGLAALLVQGLSDCAPEEVVKADPSFIELLGLKQSLTPSRNNGFLNMLKLMQKKCLLLIAEASKPEQGR